MIEFLVSSTKINSGTLGKAFAIALVLTALITQNINTAGANELILDNTKQGKFSTGKWRIYSKGNPYGKDALHSSRSGATYTFHANVPAPGEYQAFAWWTDYFNHSTSVPYDITHLGGTNTVMVNQHENGGQWNQLGTTWYFDQTATITIRSLGDGTTSVDAIMLVPVGGNTTPDPVVENTAPDLISIGDQSVSAGSTLGFEITATDPDGTTPMLDATGLPPNAVFVDKLDGTGSFTWPTTSNDAGTWNITFRAADMNDAMLRDSETVEVLVHAADNTAPRISGTPVTHVEAYDYYSFLPSASDPDGDSLSFSIKNRPSWAQFSNSSGRLKGGPDDSDAGTFGNIQISVSDGKETVSLPAFSITVNGTETQTGSVTLGWTAPAERADGSPITMSEIAGYTVYYGTEMGSYPNVLNVDDGSATSATLTDLPVGTYYLVVSTRDNEGRESGYSDEVLKVVN